MAGVRKSTAKASTVKETVKPEVISEEKAVKEASATKTAAKKAPVKKAPARRAAAKKEEVQEETAKAVVEEKAAVSTTVHLQFGGKSYTPEDLLKSCKDVWKYDLGGREEDIKSIELYVKPEENSTYYVINGDVTGSFFI